MSYRPICDTWILARPKLKPGKQYYGSYPAGFPERARFLLGASITDPVLHACGGHARHYLYPGGFGQRDKTLDIDPLTEPDYLQDARDPWPSRHVEGNVNTYWRYILIDPPYSTDDATRYRCGPSVLPTPHQLLSRALEVLEIGGRVGILHYQWAQQPRGFKESLKNRAVITVYVGQANKARVFSVFERIR